MGANAPNLAKAKYEKQILGFRIFVIYLLITKTYFPLSNSQIPRF